MACGKGNGNQPIEDFIVHSPAPVDMAAKMSAIYNELSFKVERITLKNDNLIREPFGAILVCRKETAKSNLDPTSSMLVQTI